MVHNLLENDKVQFLLDLEFQFAQMIQSRFCLICLVSRGKAESAGEQGSHYWQNRSLRRCWGPWEALIPDSRRNS